MPKIQPLLLYEVCCLSLLLLQAQTHGAPTTSSYRVLDHDRFLPLVERDTTADRQLINAERCVLLNPETEEQQLRQELLQRHNTLSSTSKPQREVMKLKQQNGTHSTWTMMRNEDKAQKLAKKKISFGEDQPLLGAASLNNRVDDNEEEEEESLNIRPRGQECTHGKHGKQKRQEQRDDRKKESDRTRAGRHRSHEYREDKHGGSSFVQREPLRTGEERYRANECQERERERYEVTTTASTAVGVTEKISEEKNFTEMHGYKTEQTAALEEMHQKELSNSTPHEATFTNRARYSKFDSVAEKEQEQESERTLPYTKCAATMPVVISSDDDELQLDADDAEVDSEWGEPESFSPERRMRELEGLPPYLPSISGCRSVVEYKLLNSVKEGTFGIVYRAREKRTGEIVALKELKLKGFRAGVPITALREIGMLLKAGDHPNILNLLEVVFSPNMDKIYLVMEFIGRDLEGVINTVLSCRGRFTTGEVKNLFRQLLSGVAHLHDKWILHRDLKPSNLLLTNEDILKIGDFGLSREYGDPLKPYSPHVITLWYRPPELLLGGKKYSTAVDMWSCGCIFAELLKMRVLFPGDSELEQIMRIFSDLGTPNDTVWHGYSSLPAPSKIKFKERAPGGLEKKFTTSVIDKKGLELLKRLLTYDPALRLSARGALDHEWFLHFPAPSPVYMTVYEQGRREKRKSTVKTPPTRVVGHARHEGHSVEIDKSLEDSHIEPKKENAGPSSAMQLINLQKSD